MTDEAHNHDMPPARLSRRTFLAGAGATAAAGLTSGPLVARCLAEAAQQDAATAEGRWARVVEVRSDHVLVGRTVHPTLLRNVLRVGLSALTGRKDEREAWRTLLAPEDVIGIKFNRSGADALGITAPLVEALVASLTEAGWTTAAIVPIEIPRNWHEKLGTTPPREDWLPAEVTFGEYSDRLAGVLDQVTAIINVPFLKHHNIAGMTCSLKNLSHALVKHPARYHADKCTPYIGDIVALPLIRGKLRLHLVNALRVVIDKGPEAHPPNIIDRKGLLFALDPVAVDSLGLEILNRTRLDGGLGKIEDEQGPVTFLAAAAARGLGRDALHEIDYVRHRL
jgi:hypothetical protein